MFGKRIRDLTTEDLQRLIDEEVPEDAEIEFKETVPARGNGEADAWLSGGTLGERARNKLIEEVIAFANAYGGTLFVGIQETEDKPARAAGITPVPRCADLAERFRLMCRDCIEPHIPLLESVGVYTGPDGAGVLVVHVPRSMVGPHRHIPDRECYARRADRSEKMSMREIRDLTLQLDRGIASIDARFEARTRNIRALFDKSGVSPMCIIAITAIPVVPIYLDHVHKNGAVKPLAIRIPAHTTYATGALVMPGEPHDWRPIVRGSRGVGQTEQRKTSIMEVHSDGLIEYTLTANPAEDTSSMYIGWFMSLLANSLCAIERFRRGANAPDVEYALEVRIWNRVKALSIHGFGGWERSDMHGRLAPTFHPFPRYSVGAREEFHVLSQQIETDLWHSCGIEVRENITIEYPAVFTELRIT